MYDCIIVGGGIAGLTAGIYAARAGLKTAVIEKLQYGGQAVMADKVENYPGFEGTGGELSEVIYSQAENSGVELLYDEIEHFDIENDIKLIKTTERELEAKAVILAVGAHHNRAGFKNEERLVGAGVSYCAVCDGAFFEGRTVGVIGGANSAVSEALYLSNICEKVYLFYRKDKLRADNTLVQRLNQSKNIEVIYNAEPIEVKGEDFVKSLVTTRGEYDLNAVFVAVGLSPSTECFGEMLNVDKRGYIITDQNMSTNIKGVFAAGDCRVKPLRQLITAAYDGAIAANSAIEYVHRQK